MITIVPMIKHVGKFDEYIRKQKSTDRLVNGSLKDEIEINRGDYDEPITVFGMQYAGVKSRLNITYEKNTNRTLKDLVEYNQVKYSKTKHKTETDYSIIGTYFNFVPIEMSYENDKANEKMKFDRNTSNYKTKFWEVENYPSMKNVFDKYYKDQLIEEPNLKQ